MGIKQKKRNYSDINKLREQPISRISSVLSFGLLFYQRLRVRGRVRARERLSTGGSQLLIN